MIILWYTMRTIIKKNKNANIKNEDKKIDENLKQFLAMNNKELKKELYLINNGGK